MKFKKIIESLKNLIILKDYTLNILFGFFSSWIIYFLSTKWKDSLEPWEHITLAFSIGATISTFLSYPIINNYLQTKSCYPIGLLEKKIKIPLDERLKGMISASALFTRNRGFDRWLANLGNPFYDQNEIPTIVAKAISKSLDSNFEKDKIKISHQKFVDHTRFFQLCLEKANYIKSTIVDSPNKWMHSLIRGESTFIPIDQNKVDTAEYNKLVSDFSSLHGNNGFVQDQKDIRQLIPPNKQDISPNELLLYYPEHYADFATMEEPENRKRLFLLNNSNWQEMLDNKIYIRYLMLPCLNNIYTYFIKLDDFITYFKRNHNIAKNLDINFFGTYGSIDGKRVENWDFNIFDDKVITVYNFENKCVYLYGEEHIEKFLELFNAFTTLVEDYPDDWDRLNSFGIYKYKQIMNN